ncbi:MAG: ABC transporter permease [Spirochaetaceae bacterium]|nr:MAG: ABC transporter permease [Spirochaetaceae bacterium]
MFAKMALLNLWKYRRRMLVVLLGIVMSVLVMEVIGGMLAGMQTTFFNEILRGSGHVQLHSSGWDDRLDSYSIRHLIADPDPLVAQIAALPDVVRVETVLGFQAMLAHDGTTLAVEGRGVAPDTSFFDDATTTITEGSFVAEERPGLVLSADNARLLGVSVGDTVGVFIQSARGIPARRTLMVTGLFDSGHVELDGTAVFLRHEDAQALLGIERATNEIRITLDDPDRAARFVSDHRELFDRHDLEPVTWRDIHGSLIVFVEISDLLTTVINAFVMIVAASVVTNAILMTVFDRARTFATLRAIGMKRRRVIATIVSEGVLLGAIGSAIGLAIGIPIVLYFQTHGLDMGELSQFFGTGQTYYFAFVPGSSATAFGFGVLISVASALYAGTAVTRVDLRSALEEA